MSNSISSKRYAQAIFQLATEKNQFDQWLKDLNTIASFMANKDFSAAMENPKLSFDVKSKIITESLKDISQLALNLCFLLASKKKTSNADQIAREYKSLLDNYRGTKQAKVITAINLDNEDKNSLIQHLGQLVKSKLTVEYSTEPEIIGGFIARIDDSLIDGSIKNKLELLKKDISGTNN